MKRLMSLVLVGCTLMLAACNTEDAAAATATENPYVGTWEGERGTTLEINAADEDTMKVKRTYLSRMTGTYESEQIVASLSEDGAMVVGEGPFAMRFAIDPEDGALMGGGARYMPASGG